MKKIKKYSKQKDCKSKDEKLKSYLRQSNRILSARFPKILSPKIRPSLAGLVPLMAASLMPTNAYSQCDIAIFDPSNSVPANTAGSGTDMDIDVDGDGTIDFKFDASTGDAGGGQPQYGDVFILPQNGAEVLCYAGASAGFFYATKFNTSDAITSAGPVWKDGPSLTDGMATLDYQLLAPWHGVGVVTGYVGIRIDGNKLGFMEVIWDNGVQLTVTPTLTGVQSASQSATTTVNAGDCIALPVELISFKANIQDSNSMLNWATASETNNQGFEIQRSIDGTDFRKIGWVQGQGNSGERIDYTFEDHSLMSNTQYYYRLKQLDYDGKYDYSPIESVIYEDANGFVLADIVPNPASESILIQWDGQIDASATFKIFDARGTLMKTKFISSDLNESSYQMDIQDLPSGIYYLKIGSESNMKYKKFVKQQ